MKKLHILTVLVLSTIMVQAEQANFQEYKHLADFAQARRTDEQKSAYKDNKMQEGAKPETPEFRFALKLSEYQSKLLRGEMSSLAFIQEISRKVKNYLDNKEHPKHSQAVYFLNTYLSLPLAELQHRVGTKNKRGSMKRFVDQDSGFLYSGQEVESDYSI